MKLTLLFLSMMMLISFAGCQQNKKAPESKPVVIEHKGFSIPDPLGMVSDFEAVFTASERVFLDSILTDHEKKTTNQVAVVTLNLDSTQIRSEEEFQKYILQLAQTWGVGQKEKNNGIVIAFSVKLGKIRIEVGYGLEERLTDEEAKRILDLVVLPEFSNGNYFAGVEKGLRSLFKEIDSAR